LNLNRVMPAKGK